MSATKLWRTRALQGATRTSVQLTAALVDFQMLLPLVGPVVAGLMNSVEYWLLLPVDTTLLSYMPMKGAFWNGPGAQEVEPAVQVLPCPSELYQKSCESAPSGATCPPPMTTTLVPGMEQKEKSERCAQPGVAVAQFSV